MVTLNYWCLQPLKIDMSVIVHPVFDYEQLSLSNFYARHHKPNENNGLANWHALCNEKLFHPCLIVSTMKSPSNLPLSPPTPSSHSGASMDTVFKPRRFPRRRVIVGAMVVSAILIGALFYFVPRITGNTQSLPRDQITISSVTSGLFEDFIPLRGQVAPLNSVFLDAVEGGRVDQKLVEDGALVKAGQPLAILTNSALQLEVIRSESEVTNQLNNLRTIEISLERNRAENDRAINEIEWQLKRIDQKKSRDQRLADIGFVSAAAVQDTVDEAAYWRSRLRITQQGQKTDAGLQAVQVQQLRAATTQLQANLSIARANLESLTVKAPIAGRLTAFEINPGQSLTRGLRIGQIDSPEDAKLIVNIDEHYLSRVAVGQAASLEIGAAKHPLIVRKLNPQVRSGQFEAELIFTDGAPSGLRRGQTLQPKLSLGESGQALLLPAGAFLTDSGGVFVFVANGNIAVKRAVQLGRRNINNVEITSGLTANEQVITSSYAGFVERDRLTLTK